MLMCLANKAKMTKMKLLMPPGRAGRYEDNYRLSQYVTITITVNYHGDIIKNVSNYILLVYSVHF